MPSRIIGKIDLRDHNLTRDIEHLNSVTKQPEEYDEFGQGYWKNLSIYNASGDASDTQYRTTDHCLPTEHALACIHLREFIHTHFKFDNLRMVRARSLVDGRVIPHRDFVELDRETKYFRVFVALEDNDESFHSDEHGVFQMRAGEVWYLDAGISHAAVNFGLCSRMFLCLDFMFEDAFSDTDIFVAQASVDFDCRTTYIERPTLHTTRVSEIIAATSKIINRHTFKDIVFALSKYHFIYDLPVSSCYDWVISAARQADNLEIIDKAVGLRRYLIEQRAIGQRYAINDWSA